MADNRFVPAGAGQASQDSTDEWAKANSEIEANRQRMDESQQERGKSLYETLQANKGDSQSRETLFRKEKTDMADPLEQRSC